MRTTHLIAFVLFVSASGQTVPVLADYTPPTPTNDGHSRIVEQREQSWEELNQLVSDRDRLYEEATRPASTAGRGLLDSPAFAMGLFFAVLLLTIGFYARRAKRRRRRSSSRQLPAASLHARRASWTTPGTYRHLAAVLTLLGGRNRRDEHTDHDLHSS